MIGGVHFLRDFMTLIVPVAFQSFRIKALEAIDFLEIFLSMNPDPRYHVML